MTSKTRSVRITIAAIGLATAFGVGTYALGQPPAPPAAQTVEQARAQLRAAREAARSAERTARLEGRIAFLRTRLMITPAQAPLWDRFAVALRSEEAARAQARLAPPGVQALPPTLPERLQRRRAQLTAEGQRLDPVINALTPLYAALSEQQKLLAERLLRGDGDGELRIRGDR
jgi:hypothetical protein